MNRAHDESHADLRELYGRGMEPGGKGCPSDAELVDLALGDATGDHRHELTAHLLKCRRCAASYRDLLALEAESDALRRRPRRWPWAVAAALLLVVLLPWARTSEKSETAVVRSSARAEIEPPENARLQALPSTLDWPSSPNATGYRARLYDAEAELLWESELLTGPPAVLPGVLSSQVAGDAYFWTIEIEGGTGPRRLGPYWFEVAVGDDP